MQSIKTRGRTFTGVVVEDKMQLTATIEWGRRKYVTKYERYETARTRLKPHNPVEINAKKGDIVKIVECRPISKTKKFTIVEKVGRERLFEEREARMEESKTKSAEEAKVKKDEKKVAEEKNES